MMLSTSCCSSFATSPMSPTSSATSSCHFSKRQRRRKMQDNSNNSNNINNNSNNNNKFKSISIFFIVYSVLLTESNAESLQTESNNRNRDSQRIFKDGNGESDLRQQYLHHHLHHQQKQKQDDVVTYILQNLSSTSSSAATSTWLHDEDATLLDVFGEVAKDVLTNRLIPETDAICDWSWKHVRCEPYCRCSLQFQWGDYHVGRSCRHRLDLHSNDDDNDDDDDDNDNDDDNEDTLKCHLPPNTKVVQLFNTYTRVSNIVNNAISKKWNGFQSLIDEKVNGVKDDVCTSFFLNSGNSGIGGAGVGDFFNTRKDNDDVDDDVIMNNGALMEKPIRALRKVMKCNNVGLEDSRSRTEEKNAGSNKSKSDTLTNHNMMNGVILGDSDADTRKNESETIVNLKLNAKSGQESTLSEKDNLHNDPFLKNDPK